jgi:hypothetical protein
MTSGVSFDSGGDRAGRPEQAPKRATQRSPVCPVRRRVTRSFDRSIVSQPYGSRRIWNFREFGVLDGRVRRVTARNTHDRVYYTIAVDALDLLGRAAVGNPDDIFIRGADRDRKGPG